MIRTNSQNMNSILDLLRPSLILFMWITSIHIQWYWQSRKRNRSKNDEGKKVQEGESEVRRWGTLTWVADPCRRPPWPAGFPGRSWAWPATGSWWEQLSSPCRCCGNIEMIRTYLTAINSMALINVWLETVSMGWLKFHGPVMKRQTTLFYYSYVNCKQIAYVLYVWTI